VRALGIAPADRDTILGGHAAAILKKRAPVGSGEAMAAQ
jgi:hypothetical protein